MPGRRSQKPGCKLTAGAESCSSTMNLQKLAPLQLRFQALIISDDTQERAYTRSSLARSWRNHATCDIAISKPYVSRATVRCWEASIVHSAS